MWASQAVPFSAIAAHTVASCIYEQIPQAMPPACVRLTRRHWPMEEEPWALGVITDYREPEDEHCIVYHINTDLESYEWFRIRCCSHPTACFVLL